MLQQVSKTKEKLYSYQEELERQQREEEDRLMANFQVERKKEAESMEKELNDEWEEELKGLTEKYEATQKKKEKTVSLFPVHRNTFLHSLMSKITEH